MLRRFVRGVQAMAGTEQEEQQRQGQQQGGGGRVVPLDAAAADELCIWILSNMSGIAMVRYGGEEWIAVRVVCNTR